MQSKLFVIGVAAAAALYLAYEWLAVPAPAPFPLPAATAPAAPAGAGAAPAAPAPAPAPAPAAPLALPSTADLARKFSAATSMRAFVYEALKKPEEGGYQYAFAALDLCKYDGTTLRLAPTASAQQKAAHEVLSRRCDMSAADRDAARLQIAADRRASFDRDPYLSLAFDRIAAIDDPERRRVVAAILHSGDALALQYLNTETSYQKDGLPYSGVYFAGAYYPGDNDSGMFGHALMIAMCSLGLDCGPQSSVVLMLCVHRGWCADSVGEAIRIGVGPGQAQLYAQIEALAARLVVEIRRRNVMAFVRG